MKVFFTGKYQKTSHFLRICEQIQKVFSHLEQVPALLGLKLEVEGVPDSDGGGGAALVLDEEPHSAVQGVLRRQVGDGNGLAGPGQSHVRLCTSKWSNFHTLMM